MDKAGSRFSEEGRDRWAFQGYKLDPSSFVTAMVHLYRGEIQRANTWRQRLDATTNWAVITTGAALTFVFAEPANPHFVFLLVLLLVLTFLVIEARRYRYYGLWSYRVHLMETDFLAAIFVPPFRPSPDWGDKVAQTLADPSFPLGLPRAVGRRLRRNYIWLVSLLLISWMIKLSVHPTETGSWREVLQRAAIGPVSGAYIAGGVLLIYGALLWMTVAAGPPGVPSRVPEVLQRIRGPLLRRAEQRERLATIITSQGEAVAARILEELGRGVTALEGRGMYSGKSWDVLLCAVTDVQVAHLREIVRAADAEAFVVVGLTAEVRGGGFQPFEPPS